MTNEQTMRAPVRPIANVAEAREAIRLLDETVDALAAIIEQESALVRAGRLVELARLAARKEELARVYHLETQRVKECLPRLRGQIGDLLQAAKARHVHFHARLQASLTVLATAHAVSEGIIRGLSHELTRKAAPQTYGASGRQTAARAGAQPFALSRTL
jgi:hypothetical protein